MSEINEAEELRQHALTSQAPFQYKAGLMHGRDQLLHEICQLLYHGPHADHCMCDPCNIVKAAKKGREALFIEDESTREASMTRRLQSLLSAPGDPQGHLGFGKDKHCSMCHGQRKNCFLDTVNWRLCPHAT